MKLIMLATVSRPPKNSSTTMPSTSGSPTGSPLTRLPIDQFLGQRAHLLTQTVDHLGRKRQVEDAAVVAVARRVQLQRHEGQRARHARQREDLVRERLVLGLHFADGFGAGDDPMAAVV